MQLMLFFPGAGGYQPTVGTCPKTRLVPDAACCIQLIQRVDKTDKTVTSHRPPTPSRCTPPPTPHPVSFPSCSEKAETF